MIDVREELGSSPRISAERSQDGARHCARTHFLNPTHTHAHMSTPHSRSERLLSLHNHAHSLAVHCLHDVLRDLARDSLLEL